MNYARGLLAEPRRHKGRKGTKIKCVMYQQLPAVESSLNNPTVQVSDTTGDAIKNYSSAPLTTKFNKRIK